MTTSENKIITEHPNSPRFEIEAEHCSVCGKRPPNEDYVLYEKGVGACVADGIGGAPMGDAASRYACHVAMEALRKGRSTRDAIKISGDYVSQFVNSVNSPRSGTSLVVAKVDGETLEVSWAGDVAVFILRDERDETSLMTSFKYGKQHSLRPICGNLPAAPGELSVPLERIKALAICTDGVWKSAGEEEIAKLLFKDISPRETVARLVLEQQSEDDSTALVMKVRRCEQVRGASTKGAIHP